MKSFTGSTRYRGIFAIFLAVLSRFTVEMEPEREEVMSAMVAFFTVMVQYLREELYDVYNAIGDYLGVPRAPPEWTPGWR